MVHSPRRSRARPDRSSSTPSAEHRERTTLGLLLIVGGTIALIGEFAWVTTDASPFDTSVVVVLLVLLITVGIALLLATDGDETPAPRPHAVRSASTRPRQSVPPRSHEITIVPPVLDQVALVLDGSQPEGPVPVD